MDQTKQTTDATYLVIARGVGEHKVVDGRGAGGQINAPVSLPLAAVGAIAALGDIIDPSVGGFVGGFSDDIDKTEDFFWRPRLAIVCISVPQSPMPVDFQQQHGYRKALEVASVVIRPEGRDKENDEDRRDRGGSSPSGRGA